MPELLVREVMVVIDSSRWFTARWKGMKVSKGRLTAS